MSDVHYVLNAQLRGTIGGSAYEDMIASPGIPAKMLEDAIRSFSGSGASPFLKDTEGEEKLKKENEELWKVINEQRELQAKTFEQLARLKGKVGEV